jgi:hypothetical protein
MIGLVAKVRPHGSRFDKAPVAPIQIQDQSET